MKATYPSISLILLAFIMGMTLSAQNVQRQQLRPTNPVNGESIGYATATDGEILVATTKFTRQAYIFERVNDQWRQVDRVKGMNEWVDRQASKGFGQSIALDGDMMAISAPNSYNGSTKGVGLIELFTKNNGTWTFDTILRANRPEEMAKFGEAMDMNEGRIIVGAPNYNFGTGQAFIYTKEGHHWKVTRLEDPNSSPTFKFGSSVAIRGNIAIVGAPGVEEKRQCVGAFYVYQLQDDGNWTLIQKVKGNRETRDVGQSLELRNNFLAVGAYETVLMYQLEGNNWIEQTRLENPDAGEAMSFASTLAVSPDESNLVASANGKAYLYSLVNGSWQFVHTFADGETGFGTSNSAGNDFILINSPYEGEEYINGAIYLYDIAPLMEGLLR